MPNVATHLAHKASILPDKTALICGASRRTFGELWHKVQELAGALRARGFIAGERLGIMLPTGEEFILYEFATFVLGGTVVPINLFYTANELQYLLSSYDVNCLVIHEDYLSKLDSSNPSAMLRQVIVCGPSSNHPAGTTRVNESKRDICSSVALVERRRDDIALVLHTSATTGRAKGVMLTLENLSSNYDQTPGWLGVGEADRILCALPLYNTFGLNQCINACMVTGATLVLVCRFDPELVLETLASEQCTFLPAVPAMLQKLLNVSELSRYDLSSLRRMLLGGAPVSAPLLEHIYRIMGAGTVVMTGYGLTEATALVSLDITDRNPDGTVNRPKCVGKALPGIDIEISRPDGQPAMAAEVGEIRIRGPNIMQGYYRMPEETAAAVRDGWLSTGDLGYLDEDRRLYVVDRKKDLIIRGGQNVYPSDIEERLYAHPAVSEAAAIGKADDHLGEVPVAFVALRPGHAVMEGELLAWCKAHLAYFKVPREIYILPELPKGPTGKILRRGLRIAASNDPSPEGGSG